jgi:ubiquitin-conjugating enzyme E2 H
VVLSAWMLSTRLGHLCSVGYLSSDVLASRVTVCSDMINIFEVFLPQLLRYPNPNDPLNGEAAALLMRHPKEYDSKVKGASRMYL